MRQRHNWDLKYSLRTVALAFDAITELPGGDLKQRLFRYARGLTFEDPGSKARWAASARERIEARNPSVLNEVVEDVAKEGPRTEVFLISLKADGYNITEDGTIVPLLATADTPAQEESVLKSHLSDLGWDVAKKHLTEGVSSYEHGNWAAANSQFRTFLEEAFNRIANNLPEGSNKLGGEARKFLQESEFLSEEEGTMVQSIFNFLHTKGSHPGLSEEFEARMRRYLVLVIALYFIEKFNSQKTINI